MTEKTKVNARSSAVEAMSKDWPMLNALMGGTRTMREAGKAFLPQFPAESEEKYQRRLSVSVLHPVFQRTVQVMAARPFVQPMTFDPEVLPASIAMLAENCDRNRSSLDEYFADRFVECLAKGITGVLVDHTEQNARTVEEQKRLGARPYFCTYPAESILGFREEGGRLSQIRLLEHHTEPDGDFGEKVIEQVRVLEPGSWKIYRKTEKDEWVVFDEGITTIDFVPFVFLYGFKKGFGIGVSPLLELAYQNVEHWQSCSDQQNILHVARVPVLLLKCLGNDTVKVSSDSALETENKDADARWIEHSGVAIGAGNASILALEDRMQQSGAELLVKRPGNTTATQVLSENESNESLLQRIVEEFENGVSRCLEFAALWTGNKFTPNVGISKYFSINPDPSDMNNILSAFAAGIVTKDMVLKEMTRRGLIVSDA